VPCTRNFHGKGFLVDGGAERLILEWKAQRGRWIAKQGGKKAEDLKSRSPHGEKIAFEHGARRFTDGGAGGSVSAAEQFLMTNTLAIVERDGVDDREEWNLFERYLPAEEDVESLDDRHSLSDILRFWDKHVVYLPFALHSR
jgi:hypothetical protein